MKLFLLLVAFTFSSSIISQETNSALEVSNMNIVYRGVTNPIKITAIKGKLIEATAPGLKKIDDNGNYVMRPQTGKTVDVKVKSLLKNGDTITDYKTLRIEDLGKLIGKINGFGCGKKCWVNLKKNELQNSKISIELSNVMFDWEFKVKSFRIKQLGESQIINFQGNKIDLKSFKKLKNLKKGDKIQIFDIRFSSNANIRAKNPAPILIEIID